MIKKENGIVYSIREEIGIGGIKYIYQTPIDTYEEENEDKPKRKGKKQK